MKSLRYTISADVFDAHPDYCRGLVILDSIDNSVSCAPLAALLREAEAQVRKSVQVNVADDPRVAAWRDAYRRFGAKPSEHRSSIEALLRRVVKGNELPSINPLVDIGNIVSLRCVLPAGAHPLEGSGQQFVLRRARPPDMFAPPDGGPSEAVHGEEIVLARGQEVLTRRWTWRQAAGTQISPGTTRVFFNIDGLSPVNQTSVEGAMHEVIRLVQAHCGGQVVHATVLTAESPALEIS
jgi:DNA/RNA-binding domain of Phe-tRNA-synthetase-like protein